MSEIVVNGRFRKQRMTGIQRVAEAIATRLRTPNVVIEPDGAAGGVAGHVWEQAVLPVKARGRLVWGPCNVGPIFGPPQILTIHGAGVFDHPEWFSPAFVRLNQALWPIVAKKARRIVTVSHFSKGRISEVLNVPADKIDVIWNGVDEQFRPCSAEVVRAAAEKVGLRGRPYFATLSTIEPRKNLKLVLEAWALARPQLPKDMALLVIGGKGSKAVFGDREIDGEADESVVFSGYVAEEMLAPLISGAQGLMYPSIYEGFGLPVLEAMACGTPAITTNLTSLPEVGGDVAIYVDEKDPADLAKQLVRLAESEGLRKELSERGLVRAKTFTWDEAARRMDELFVKYG